MHKDDRSRRDSQPFADHGDLPRHATGPSEQDLPEPDDFEDYDIFASEGCQWCGGQGFIVVCIDDMCRGAGECMHGDGEIACPDCGGI